MAVREGLEIAELSAALIVPRSRSSAVLQRKLWTGQIICAVIHWRHCLDDRVNLVEQFFQVLALQRCAEGFPLAVLHLEHDCI